MNELTYGIAIYVEDTGKTYHTLNNWGYALGNNNYIGDPEMETTYIKVPGRTGLIDASEAVAGRRVFTKRQLAFKLGGVHEKLTWDGVISALRNNVQGRICRLTLDNDPNYYWRGRVYIEDFDRFQGLGTFTISVPTAEPYKYSKSSSSEPWLWDPFNFETDVITYLPSQEIVVSGTITIPAGHMLTSPTFIVADIVGDSFTVDYNGITYPLTQGTNSIPSIMVGGDAEVQLDFTGTAKVQVNYRSGSL